LAIAVNIEHHSGKPRKLKLVTCAFWELDGFEYLDARRPGGDLNLNVLERCDGFDDDDETVHPAGKRYTMVSKIPELRRIGRFTAAQTEFFQVSVPYQCVVCFPYP
jgi:hypothetical protein